MEKLNRLLTNICSDDLSRSKEFYTTLFDFELDFYSDWFVHLISKDMQLELGIIDQRHETVPTEFQTNPAGFYITFVVDSVEEVYEIAKSASLEVVSKPADTFYGQRRLLLKDPDGTLVDVSSPIPDFEF